MLSLSGRICSRNQRSGFDQAKLPLAKEPPTLPRSQAQAIRPLDVRSQGLSVPEIAAQPKIRRPFSQCVLYFRHLLGIQPTWASRALPFLQSGQTLLLKAAHPIFNRSRSVTQQLCDAATFHALSNKQHPVQTVVIPGFGTSSNFVLQRMFTHAI